MAAIIPEYKPPSHIDLYTKPDDGVWFPDAVKPQQGWQSSGSLADSRLSLTSQGYFNPFAGVADGIVELCFTEELPSAAQPAPLQ